MNPSDIEVRLALRNSDRRAQAKAVLGELATPRAWVYALSGAATAVVVGYFAERSGLQSTAQALVVGLATGLVVTAIDHWSLRRRLEAVIELLKLGES